MSNEEDSKQKSFFSKYRLNGYGLTLNILFAQKNKQMTQSDFFIQLKKKGSYPNEWFRSKENLLGDELVKYKLDRNYDKVLFLTDLGILVVKKIREIEQLIKEGLTDDGE